VRRIFTTMNYALRVVTPVVVLTAACSSGFRPQLARPAAERPAPAPAQTAAARTNPGARAHDADAHHAGHHMPTSATSKPATPRLRKPAPGIGTTAAQAKPVLEALGRAPLAFEAHQTDANVFVSHTPAYTLHVGPGYADILPAVPTAKGGQVRMRLIDANTDMKADAGSPLPGTVSYITGNDPSQWRTSVATYAKIRYEAVYPGVDLVYYGTQREIEYDFVVNPGASPSRIALGFDGVDALAIKDNGDLELIHGGQPLVLRAPRAYQTIAGRQVTVDSSYRIDDATRQVSLTVGDYDREQPLVIDPILSYAMALGGVGQDEGNAVAVDGQGNVYVTGLTRSPNFPASGTAPGHFDIFVTKLDPSGSVVLSSTFIGGSGPDEPRSLAIDASGNAYVTGVTRSTNFPVHGGVQGALSGESDAFVVKVSTTGGGVQFSTYLGGSGLDEGTGVAIDGARNVYVTGTTRSTDFPTASPRQGALAGNTDSFTTKLNTAGSSLVYSSYLGGTATDIALGIAVDAAGNATVVGTTNSGDFPLLNAAQSTISIFDAFVTKMTPSGALVFSTFHGGGDIDSAQAVTLDDQGRPIITGTTASTNFPVVAAFQSGLAGGLDAFVAGFSNSGQSIFSTYLGGTGSDRGRGIARDGKNRLYVIGQTFSADFPSINPVQPKIGGNRDTFVVMLSPPAYNAITYATYLGGGHNDDGLGIAADSIGRAFVTGATMYAWPDLAGASDAFVMRLSSGAAGEDSDGDGMTDEWETKYSGEDLLPGDDLDGDGVLNINEFQNNTHPLGYFTQYLAEGATGPFFDTQLALFNPGNTSAVVLLRFQIEGQAEVPMLISLPPRTRRALNVDTDVPGLAEASFATVAESDAQIVVDRTMTWDANGFGSHAETAAAELSKNWYLAEGATHGAFDLFYLLQNPHPTQAATVDITYLRPEGQAPITVRYEVPARGRLTVNVDAVETVPNQPPNQRPLRATDVSASIASDLPILVERAMYQTGGGRLFNAGHESMGISSPSTSWFFAEGATGGYFDMYLLLANPSDQDAFVKIDYLFAGGGVLTKENIHVAGKSRKTLSIDGEDPLLADAAMSMRITSTVPIIAERAMWWPSPRWHEAHNSAGSVITSPRWAVAEGEVGGTRNLVTYVLIANTSASDALVKVSPFYEDLAIAEPKYYTVPANSRFNVDIGGEFAVSEGSKFSVLVEAQGPQELVVERAMYSNSRGVTWAAGTNALGTPLFPDATFIITPGGIFPKKLVVEEGARVKFINRDAVKREMSSDEHPLHEDCPPINDASPVLPGQEKLTGNMILDPGRHACGVHDHNDPSNDAVRAKIIVR
jgi:Beta-propeller repeat